MKTKITRISSKNIILSIIVCLILASSVFAQEGGIGNTNNQNTGAAKMSKSIAEAAIKGVNINTMASASYSGYSNTTNSCISCHNDTGYPADTDGNGIAAPYERPHNDKVMCEYCHGSNPHSIQYIQPNGSLGTSKETAATCIDCHQTGTVPANNTNFSTAYVTGNELHHSNDPNNGSIWTRGGPTFWINQSTACLYCHGETKHNVTALGKPSRFNGSNTVRTWGTWCGSCHYNGNTQYSNMLGTMGIIPPEITGDPIYGNYISHVPTYYNHGGIGSFLDTTCTGCHGSKPNVSAMMHDTSSGQGGPNCVSCHDVNAHGAPYLVNVSATDEGIHKDLNKDAVTSLDARNKKCWACHGDGNQPTQHPTTYKTPAQCVDCHAGSNRNFTPSDTILTVSEHYWNGSQIKTLGVSSCYQCHNKSEMMIFANDPDTGSGAIYGGANGGNNSTSHYGKKRGDLELVKDTKQYCNYCHNSSTPPSSFFDVFIDIDNTNIQNHSRYGTNPPCQDCHSTGRIHNASLNFSALALPTSDICLTCHGPTGTASIKDKSKHNNTVDCSICHLSNGKDIHPVKYLNNTGGFGLSKDQGVKCIDCHETGLYNAPAIGKLQHSDNIYNGSLWNESRPSIFWDNNSLNTACNYCHGDSKHNVSALGKLNGIKGTNVVNVFGTWCGICHYQGNGQFSGMTGVFNPLVPPEISGNVTYGNYIQARDGTHYFNHQLSSYNDTKCDDCHYAGEPPNLTKSVHNVASGKSGPDCISCHNVSAHAASALIDAPSMNDSNNIHKDLNKDVNGAGVDPQNKKCWACHGNGSKPTQHPSNYRTPYNCTDCHSASGNRNFTPSNTIKVVSEHYLDGAQIKTPGVSSCYKCHNKSVMMIAANDPDSGSVYGGVNGGNNSTSHYGKKRTDLAGVVGTREYCDHCHNSTKYPAESFFDVFVDVGNKDIQNHSRYGTNPPCQDCHDSPSRNSRIHDDNLTFSELTLPTSDICLTCHGPTGTASIKNKSKHNNVVDCSVCHLETNKDIHPVKYLNNTGGFGLSKDQGVKCIDCHETGLYNAPAIGKLQHSENTWNGSLWSTGDSRPSIFWDNNSLGTACNYCHGDTKHNASALGRLTGIKGSNVVNVFGTWCGICHYQGNSQFGSMIGNFSGIGVPPEISRHATYGNYPSGARDGGIYFNHSLSAYNDTRCDDCHYSGTPPNLTKSVHNVITGGSSCLGCHAGIDVDITKMGKHANVSKVGGNLVVTDDDCKGCHFGVLTLGQMLPGYTNSSNTYYCQDCHAPGGRNPSQYNNMTDPNLTIIGFKHAKNNCQNCHTNENASIYHVNGPLGTAEGKNCYSCHYRSDGGQYPADYANVGLNSSPFYAPGEDHLCNKCHTVTNLRPPLSGPEGCNRCHGPAIDLSANDHNVTYGKHPAPTAPNKIFSITSVAVTTPVNIGNMANVTARLNHYYVQIVKAQYRITDSTGSTIIRDWTEMNATDGKFNNRTENVKGRIDTAGLSAGTYQVQVRGMASGYWGEPTGGIAHNVNLPYYPDNGIWTNTVSVTMNVTCPIVFSDVPCGYWGYPYIMYLYYNGVVSGYPDGTFRPDNLVSRAEFATIITTALGLTYTGGISDFPDVPRSHWAYPYVMAAKQAGIVSGYPDGTFRPDNLVSRAEIASMITDARGWTYTGGLSDFPDVSQNHWAYPYVMAVRQKDIVSGYPDGTFRPDNSATRAESSTMVKNMMTTP